MTIGSYHNIKEIVETYGAVLYEASGDDSPFRMFILKKYNDKIADCDLLEYEKAVSQEIENYASDSIVVPIFNVVEDQQGNRYAVMKKKRTGVFLHSMVKKDGLSARDAFRVAETILKSLCTLHSFAGSDPRIGYLHLDLHPGNVFIENDSQSEGKLGSAKFIDFATAVKTLNDVPQTRGIRSISAYSAPERYRYGSDACSSASDTYSVGAILYVLLTGKNLPGIEVISGTTIPAGLSKMGPQPNTCRRAAEIAGKHCREKGEPESICMMIEAFFRCSLNYNPLYRYRTAREMLESVRRIQKVFRAYDTHNYEEFFNMLYEYGFSVDEINAGDADFSGRDFREAVYSLESMLVQDYIEHRRTKYLFDAYWRIAQNHKDEIYGDVMYRLIGSGIAVSNHTGDVRLGNELYGALSDVSERMELGQYLNLLNRVAVQKADRFKFGSAIEIQRKNIQAQKYIKEGIVVAGQHIGKESEMNTRIIPLARALSSLPGYLVLDDRNYPDSEIWDLYDEALLEFGPDIGNRRITLCHMMHYAITSNNLMKYEQLAAEYFHVDNRNILENLEKVLQEIVLTGAEDTYGLFVLVKGLYTFYANDISNQTLEALRRAGEELLETENATDPVMLIYKYIGLWDYHLKGELTEFASDMFRKSLTCVREGIIDEDFVLNVYMLISYQTATIYNDLMGDKEANSELRKTLRRHAERDGWDELVNVLDEGTVLSNLLCWEYA